MCCACEKKLVSGDNWKWYAATTAIDILSFFILSKLQPSKLCVCVCWGGGVQKHLYPPCLPGRGNTVPYLTNIYRKPCTWWHEFSLELSFEAQLSLQIFWRFKFSFCMYLQRKRLKSNNILEYFWHLCAIF